MGENIKFAVIKVNNRQYIVSENQEILVDKVDEANLDSQVLLYSNDEIYVGKPVLENVKVKLEIVEKEEKGEKLSVFKYKAKSRYRKKIGFRPSYTRLRVAKISLH